MSDLPNTDSINIIDACIAWEIVKATTLATSSAQEDPNEFLKKVTNAYIKVFKSIGDLTPIED